ARKPRRCSRRDRRRVRGRRGRRRGADARRLSGQPCRPAAGARRGDLGPRQFRGRGAGRRSAPGQAPADRHAQGTPRAAHAAREPASRAHLRTTARPGERQCKPEPAACRGKRIAVMLDRLRGAGLSIILAWGWKRALIALAAGALSTLAMAPFNAWPVLFLTFSVAIWQIDGAGAGRMRGIPAAALTGWCFGIGYFVPGLYWIGNAFLVDPSFAWLMPFAVLGLPAYLALFTAFGFALARLLWTRDGSRVLALAIGLTIAEWLRGHVLTGFPWNAYGYALFRPLALAQTASLIGLWGMTFLTVAIFASPAALIDGASRGRKPWIAPAAAVAVLVAMGIYGAIRLSMEPTRLVGNVRIRI